MTLSRTNYSATFRLFAIRILRRPKLMVNHYMPKLTASYPDLSADVSSDERLPMREVVRLTGVNPVTLRAWERRYGLIQPLRTEGGHRLYSQQDVATIRNIIAWTERGIAVSKVGELLERNRSLSTSTPRVGEASGELMSPGKDPLLAEQQSHLLQAIATFDESRMEQLYALLSSTGTLSCRFERVLMPVWYELLHQNGFGQRSQWLFYDTFLRTRILQQLYREKPPAQSVLVAALPEQCQELEVLVTGLLLSGREWSDREFNVKVLGPGQPLDELPLVCQAIKPRALVLWTPAPVTAAQRQQLERLVLAIDCPLALAGVGAELSADALRGTPIACLGQPAALMLQRLRQFIDARLDT